MSEELSATIDAAHAPSKAAGPKPFDYSTIPPGHYDLVYKRSRGIQSKWHHLKFERVLTKLEGYERVLDVGCGPGTLVGMLGPEHEAVGVDITEEQIEYARRVYGGTGRSFYSCALEELPERERKAVAAVHVEGRSYSEAAAATGIPLGSLKRHLRDGLARLRQALGARLEGASE